MRRCHIRIAVKGRHFLCQRHPTNGSGTDSVRAWSGGLPGCGSVSRRANSRYERRLCDTAVAGQKTIGTGPAAMPTARPAGGHPGRGSLAPVAVRRKALFDHMEVRDRPSARCPGSGLELEAA